MFEKYTEKVATSWSAADFQEKAKKNFGFKGLGAVPYQMTTGEQLLMVRLNTLKEAFAHLKTSLIEGGRDFSTHRDLLQALKDLKLEVSKYLNEPKATQMNTLLDEAYITHYTYHDEGDLGKSKNRIGGKLTVMQGILQTPVPITSTALDAPSQKKVSDSVSVMPSPVTTASSPWKKIILTAGVTATVGLIVREIWTRYF